MASNATRFTLVKCMRKLLRQQPFSKITIGELCELAHISRRSFYRYFPDKYSLLAATYQESFFSKIQLAPDSLFWDLFKQICQQVYGEKEFFRHAFEVKGQNGFWEEARKILTPYMKKDYPSNVHGDVMFNFFVAHSIDMLFELVEHWIREEPTTSPDEFATFIQESFAVYGKWIYEASTNRPRSAYTPEIVREKKW